MKGPNFRRYSSRFQALNLSDDIKIRIIAVLNDCTIVPYNYGIRGYLRPIKSFQMKT